MQKQNNRFRGMSVFSGAVFAQGVPDITNLVPVTGRVLTVAEVTGWIYAIARFLITVGPVIAVIMIVWGGITYMMAGADEDKVAAAKSRIKNGIIGALVVFGVGTILQSLTGFITGQFFNGL